MKAFRSRARRWVEGAQGSAGANLPFILGIACLGEEAWRQRCRRGFGDDSWRSRPKDNETFYREVDEELRRDQLKTSGSATAWLVIAGVVLLLAAIGGFIWWQNQQQVEAGERGEDLIAAFDDIAARSKAAAAPKLDELAKSGAPATAPPPC